MSGSQGRRSTRYLTARRHILGQPCHECGTPTTTHGPNTTRADHQPPIGNTPEHTWWANGGTLKPHCPTCSSRQGANITNQQPSRKW